MLTVEVIERRGQSPSAPEFDISADGVMDLKDRDEWLLLAAIENGFAESFLLGDGDLNGSVDAADLMMVGLNWQGFYLTDDRWGWGWNGADFTMDGFTNAADLNELAKNWQRRIPAANAAVSEPVGYMLLCLSAAILVRALRSRRAP